MNLLFDRLSRLTFLLACDEFASIWIAVSPVLFHLAAGKEQIQDWQICNMAVLNTIQWVMLMVMTKISGFNPDEFIKSSRIIKAYVIVSMVIVPIVSFITSIMSYGGFGS